MNLNWGAVYTWIFSISCNLEFALFVIVCLWISMHQFTFARSLCCWIQICDCISLTKYQVVSLYDMKINLVQTVIIWNIHSLRSKEKHVHVQNINCLTITDVHCVAVLIVFIVLHQEQRVHRDAISTTRGRCWLSSPANWPWVRYCYLYGFIKWHWLGK